MNPVRPMALSLPGHRAPAVGPEMPFEMLEACHERLQRSLQLLQKLQDHLARQGHDASAAQAAQDVLRYFNLAAPLHHQDEELHVFPPLLAGADATLRELAERLINDHRQMEAAWIPARSVLQAIADSRPDADWHALTPAQADALNQFAALYQQHLADENGVAYPAAQAALPLEAVQAMSEDMMQRRGVTPLRP